METLEPQDDSDQYESVPDIVTTVNRLESDVLNLMREKFQKYTEHLLHLLNVELLIKSEDSDIVEYMIPSTTIKITFNPDNEGYGLKAFDGRDFIFVSPAEMSLEDGQTYPMEECVMGLSDTQIRAALELLKNASEGLQEYVNKRKEELQDKLDLIRKY